ncbi:MAG: hypothetical protein ACLGQX_11260 [Acidobacteriota bacterium]|jgi:hypothetical protein
MSYRPFRHLGQFMLAACAVSFGVIRMSAQSSLPQAPSPARVDVFTGYSYYWLNSKIKTEYDDTQYYGGTFGSVVAGAMGSGAYFYNKLVGVEVNITANPNGKGDGFYGYYAGAIFHWQKRNYTPFVHGLVGGVRSVGPNNPGGPGYNPHEWGLGLMAGGGADIQLPFFQHRLGWRLLEADYRYNHTDFGPAIPADYKIGGRTNMNGVELSSGLLFHFGSLN